MYLEAPKMAFAKSKKIAKTSASKGMKKHVLEHLKKDTKEFKHQIKDDSKLAKSLKKMKSK